MAGNPVDTSYQDAVAVTASDTTVYSPPLRALFVGTGGTSIAVVTAAGNTVSLAGVPNGATIPLQCKQVLSTGTVGASGIVGLM